MGALLLEAMNKPLTEVAATFVLDLSRHAETKDASRLAHGVLNPLVRKNDRVNALLFIRGLLAGAKEAQALEAAWEV